MHKKSLMRAAISLLLIQPFFFLGGMANVEALEQNASVRVYPAPKGEPLSKDFAVMVENQNVPVYLARICALPLEQRLKKAGTMGDADTNKTAWTSFASFDMQDKVKVAVTMPVPVKSAQLLPSSSGIPVAIAGNTITFTIPKAGQYVLEVNDNWINSLQLFANPFEMDVPVLQDPNVIYYGPGTYQVENITVPRGKTLYVAGGAVIYGHFTPGSSKRGPIITMEGDDAVLRGRGIIDGSQCPSHTRGILLVRGKHIRVEGVVLRDSSGWTLPMRGSEQVNISNVKIFGWRINSDGIDICGSRAVEVSGCYLRTWDDLVVVKTSAPGEGEARDITINKCVLWNERAHALSIGAELRKQVEHVRFTDCDIIRDKGHDWALRVFHCDAAQIRDVVFDDIRFDECQRFISLWIGKAKWSRDNERGHIDDITFKNIRVSGANPSIDCNGYDAEHTIHGIKFENVVINNKPLAAGDIRQNKFVSGVSLAP